jgi:hypothetical protein
MSNSLSPALSIDQALEIFPASKSVLFRDIRDGRLKARKLGARTIILREDLDAYLRALPVVEAEGVAA